MRKKQRLAYLIALLSVALLGLVVLQLYWLHQAWQVNEARFRLQVQDALHRVARDLEQKEVLYAISRFRELPADSLTLIAKDTKEAPQPIAPPPAAVPAPAPSSTTPVPAAPSDLPTALVSLGNAEASPKHEIREEDNLRINPHTLKPLTDVILLDSLRISGLSFMKKLAKQPKGVVQISIGTQNSQTRRVRIPLGNKDGVEHYSEHIEFWYEGGTLPMPEDFVVSRRDASLSPEPPKPTITASTPPLATPPKVAAPKKLVRIQDQKDIVRFALEEIYAKHDQLDKRLSQKQLDSLLRVALHLRGIREPFRFITESIENPDFVRLMVRLQPDSTTAKKSAGFRRQQTPRYLFVTQPKVKEQLLASSFKVPLFPTDLGHWQHFLYVDFPNHTAHLWEEMIWLLASSAALIALVIYCFARAVMTILQQKKLSDITNDFINNMTHELKTPIATVGLACEALQDPDIQLLPTQQRRYLGIIKDENERLAHQVEKVLQIARLDRSELQLKWTATDLHTLLPDLIAKMTLQVESRGGHIHYYPTASRVLVWADEVHLSNMLLNLLDNANKYSPQSPQITLTTRNTDNAVEISIADCGQGIPREHLHKIFDKFYRVSTGNVHNVKGFGLGLSYVRTMAEAHKGSIKAYSEVNKGSTFVLRLPLMPEDTTV